MLNSQEHENHEHEQMRQFSDKNSRQSFVPVIHFKINDKNKLHAQVI